MPTGAQSRYFTKHIYVSKINLNNEMLEEVTTFDYLDVLTSNVVSWEPHVSRLCKQTYSRQRLLSRISALLPKHVLLRIYKQTILPVLDCSTVDPLLNKSGWKVHRKELKLLSLLQQTTFFLRFVIIFK